MYRDAGSTFCGGGHKIQADCEYGTEQLLSRVNAAFPGLQVSTSRIEQSGGDHILLIVNGDIAFRFPRKGMHDLSLEIALLRALRGRLDLAVPNYSLLDPRLGVAGYRFIEGAALSPARFRRLAADRQSAVLRQITGFLGTLHCLQPRAIDSARQWPRLWTACEFADRSSRECLPLLVSRLPHLAKPLEKFLDRYRSDGSANSVIVHGDLVPDHLLLDRHSGRLAGVIDFGDVALGDPAQDFLGLWSYGLKTAARAIRLYDPDGRDEGLLARSRNHFVRYELDRLAGELTLCSGVRLEGIRADLAALLRLADDPLNASRRI